MIYRSGAHAAVPPQEGFIRAATVGVIGFAVRRAGERSCHVSFATAADLKGSIPSFLVNFVAKVGRARAPTAQRTPIKWIERLAEGVRLVREKRDKAAKKG